MQSYASNQKKEKCVINGYDFCKVLTELAGAQNTNMETFKEKTGCPSESQEGLSGVKTVLLFHSTHPTVFNQLEISQLF